MNNSIKNYHDRTFIYFKKIFLSWFDDESISRDFTTLFTVWIRLKQIESFDDWLSIIILESFLID